MQVVLISEMCPDEFVEDNDKKHKSEPKPESVAQQSRCFH